MACCPRHTAATESHQPGRHVNGDVITVEDRARTRVFPIQPVTASRRGTGGDIFVIINSKRGHQSSRDNRPRRQCQFRPGVKGSSWWRDKGSLQNGNPQCYGVDVHALPAVSMGQAAQHEGERGDTTDEAGRGSRMFGLVWTSCIRNPLRLPGRAEVQGVLSAGVHPKLRRKPPLMQVQAGQGNVRQDRPSRSSVELTVHGAAIQFLFEDHRSGTTNLV